MYVDMLLKANLVKRSSMVLITCFPAFSAMLITKGPTLAITSSRMPSCLLPLDGEINCSTEITYPYTMWSLYASYLEHNEAGVDAT